METTRESLQAGSEEKKLARPRSTWPSNLVTWMRGDQGQAFHTELLLAARQGSRDMVQLLLEKGADNCFARTDFGKSQLAAGAGRFPPRWCREPCYLRE